MAFTNKPGIAETSGFQMEKLTENMIRRAESQFGGTEYADRCLAFIGDALEISNHKDGCRTGAAAGRR